MESIDRTLPVYNENLVQQAQPIQNGPENVIIQPTEGSVEPQQKKCCRRFLGKKSYMRIWIQTYHFLLLVEAFCFLFMILGFYPLTFHSWSTILTIFVMPFFAYPPLIIQNRKIAATFLSGYAGCVFFNAILCLLSFIMLFLWYWTLPVFIGLIVKSSLCLVSVLSFAETVRMIVLEKKGYQKEHPSVPQNEDEAAIDSLSELPKPTADVIPPYPAVAETMPMPVHGENASSSFYTDINYDNLNNNNMMQAQRMEQDQQMSAFIPNQITDANNMMYAQEETQIQNAPLLAPQQPIPFEKEQQQLYSMGFTDFERNHFFLNQFNGDLGQAVSGLSKSIQQQRVPFETQMNQLYEMGFTDFERNTFFLNKFNGDVQQVLSAMVSK